MKIKTQVSISLIVFVILAGVIIFSVYSSNTQLNDIQKKQQIIDTIEKSSFELYYLENDYLVHDGTIPVERWNAKYAALTGQLQELTLTDPSQQAVLKDIFDSQNELNISFSNLVAVTGGVHGTELSPANQKLKEFYWSTLAGQTQTLMSRSSELSQLVKAEALEVEQRITLTISLSITGLMVFVLLNYLVINRSVLRSISALQKGSERIGSGDLDTKIETVSDDELGELSRAFNTMTSNLKTAQTLLLTSNTELKRENAERKRGEDTLAQSEERYRTLAEASPDQIFIIGRDDTLEYANAAALKLFRNSYERVVGKPRKDLFSPQIAKSQEASLQKVFETGESIRKDEMIQFGELELWIDTSLVPLKDKAGIVTSVLGIGRDITERKRAEEAIRTFSEELEHKVTERTTALSEVNQKLMTEIDIRRDAEKQLTKTVGEKEVLVREVHHRVKNNLQIIISLINLQSRYITDEATISAFRESQNRIKAMALVHEKLYQSTDIAKIDLDNYIRFLGNNLFQFFGMKGKGITLTIDIRNISLAIDTAIPVALMINELISNSLKYAFPDGRKGEISLAIHRQDHTLSILFKDNGVGIPPDLDWHNAKSLGLRLVISLVEQLSGTIELDRTAGTVFTIVVKEKQ